MRSSARAESVLSRPGRPPRWDNVPVAARAVDNAETLTVSRVRVTLLGAFSIRHDGRNAGPWYRPAARRLCQLVMISPSHRLGREVARDLLFPKLAPADSARALSKALSLAREGLSPLGQPASRLLQADRANIWVDDEVPLDIDAEAQEVALRSALRKEPGAERDAALSSALKQNGVLLDEEPYADWAVAPREALEVLRQRARLELARDRARGFGRSQPNAVVEAWEDCLAGTQLQKKRLPHWSGSTRFAGIGSWRTSLMSGAGLHWKAED